MLFPNVYIVPQFDFGIALAFAFAVAGFAGLFQNPARAFALRTRLGNAEDAA